MTLRPPIPASGWLDFPVYALAAALSLPSKEVLEHFRDGRHAQPLLERCLAAKLQPLGWRRARREGGGALLVDGVGGRWEMRAVTDELSLAPSRMKGTGRRFDAEGFLEHVRGHAGVLAVDVEGFPRCAYWLLTAERLVEWFDGGELGRSARVKRRDLKQLLAGLAA